MAKTFDTVQVTESQPHTLLVTLNRPEVANAMNTQMGLDLLTLFDAHQRRAERAALHRPHRRRARARSAPAAT